MQNSIVDTYVTTVWVNGYTYLKLSIQDGPRFKRAGINKGAPNIGLRGNCEFALKF